MDKFKCISCEEIIDKDDGYYTVEHGEHEDEEVCEDCYYSCEPYATVIEGLNKESPSTVSRYQLNNYETNNDAVTELLKSVKWYSSDAWRGHYKGESPTGYTEVLNSWICPTDGHTPDNLTTVIHDLHESGELEGYDYLICLPCTSNVFSMGVEVYVNKDQFKEFNEFVNQA